MSTKVLRSHLSIVALAGLVFVISLIFPLAALAKPETDEWLIEQVHESRMQTVIHVSRNAVSLHVVPVGCHFLAKAPDWKVHCFRPEENIEWIGDMAQFSGIVLTNPYASVKPIVRGLPPQLKGTGVVCGMKCDNYVIAGDEMLCSKEIVVDPQIVLFFNRLYGTPFAPSVPLETAKYRAGGEIGKKAEVNWMDTGMSVDLRKGKFRTLTTKTCKKIPFNEKDFETPKGLKRIVDLVQVSYSKDQRSEISDMLDNVGFESDLDKKNGKRK